MKPFFYYRILGKIFNVGDSWERISPCEEDAIEFAHKNINPEPKRYKDEKGCEFSLEYYLAHYGESINESYRKDRPDDIDLAVSDMIALHKTKTTIILYRGVCEDVFRLMKKNAKKFSGVDLYEKSFLQTSLVKGHEINSKYHLRIYVPSGVQAVYLGNVNNEQFYYEVDLQRGAKLKIVSIDDKYINCKLV